MSDGCKECVTNMSCWTSRLLLGNRLLSTLRLLFLSTSSLSRGLSLSGLGTVVLADRLDNRGLLLGVENGDSIGQRLLGTGLALGIRAAHDLDLDTQHTLAQQDVASSAVDKVLGGLARVDHEAIGKLHGLGTGSTKLARDDDLATLGTRLHDEAQDTIAGTTDRQTVEELVAERLALSDGGQTTVLDLGGVERDAVLGELETLLDQAGELANAAALLAEDLLGVCGADDDVGDGGGDADFDAGVALLSELALEELVQLGVENTVGDELPPLGTKVRENTLVSTCGLLGSRNTKFQQLLRLLKTHSHFQSPVVFFRSMSPLFSCYKTHPFPFFFVLVGSAGFFGRRLPSSSLLLFSDSNEYKSAEFQLTSGCLGSPF